jgi:cyclopropane fatty-acyl-phospholipid synthase-like methyltransferase
MAAHSRRTSKELAAALDLSGVGMILDVGGGPGLFMVALLERAPNARGMVLDLPETLRYTKEYVRASPCADRVGFLPGDYRKSAFGRDLYDLVLLSHVTHDESSEVNRALLRRAHSALREGGRVVIHDFMLDEDRTAPLFGALFSVHLMSYTEAGRTYGEAEYRMWLKDAGFGEPTRMDVQPGAPTASVALAARKT